MWPANDERAVDKHLGRGHDRPQPIECRLFGGRTDNRCQRRWPLRRPVDRNRRRRHGGAGKRRHLDDWRFRGARGRRRSRPVAGVGEVASTVGGRNGLEAAADELGEGIDGARAALTHQRLQLRVGVLDVGGQFVVVLSSAWIILMSTPQS